MVHAIVIWDEKTRTTLVTLDRGELNHWEREQFTFPRSRPSMEAGLLKVISDFSEEGLLFLFSGDYIYRRLIDVLREEGEDEE